MEPPYKYQFFSHTIVNSYNDKEDDEVIFCFLHCFDRQQLIQPRNKSMINRCKLSIVQTFVCNICNLNLFLFLFFIVFFSLFRSLLSFNQYLLYILNIFCSYIFFYNFERQHVKNMISSIISKLLLNYQRFPLKDI